MPLSCIVGIVGFQASETHSQGVSAVLVLMGFIYLDHKFGCTHILLQPLIFIYMNKMWTDLPRNLIPAQIEVSRFVAELDLIILENKSVHGRIWATVQLCFRLTCFWHHMTFATIELHHCTGSTHHSWCPGAAGLCGCWTFCCCPLYFSSPLKPTGRGRWSPSWSLVLLEGSDLYRQFLLVAVTYSFLTCGICWALSGFIWVGYLSKVPWDNTAMKWHFKWS